jgi:hypothetical protein
VGEFDYDLALFGEYVADAEKAAYHAKWVKANPVEAAAWAGFRDAVLVSGSGAVPVMRSAYGKALVHAGELGMSVSRFVGMMAPRPPASSYPPSYFTGPLGQNNILPTRPGAFWMTWGPSNEGGATTWTEFKNNMLTRETLMGRTYDGIMATYFPEFGEWAEGRMQWIHDHGSIPIMAGMHFNPLTTSQIANGEADSQIDAYGDHFAFLGFPIIVRLFHEFDLSHLAYTAVGQTNTFISAWRRVVDRIHARGATNVGFWWCPTEGGDRATSLNSWPGDEYVDWAGSDNYNQCFTGETECWSSPLHPGYSTFAEIFDYGNLGGGVVAQHDLWGPRKPFMIGETGCSYDSSRPGDKRDWYAGVPGAARNMEYLRGVAWFDQDVSGLEGPRNNWLVSQSGAPADILAAWITASQDSWFNTRS